MVKRLPAVRETQVQPLGWEDPLEKEMGSMGSKELDTTEQLHFHMYIYKYSSYSIVYHKILNRVSCAL